MVKPVLRDGWYYHRERVPHDILKSFERTRTGKPKTEIWIALRTQNRTDANRALPAAQVAARERFDAARKTLRGTAEAVPARKATRTPQEACAAFYATLQEQERARRIGLVDYAKAHPDAFWSGDLIQIPPVEQRSRDGFHGVMGKGLAMDMERRLSDARGALAVMDMHYVREATGETDESLLPLLARTEIAFLEAVLRDPGYLFGAMPPLGTVSLASSAVSPPTDVPLLSAAVARWRPIKVDEGWAEGGNQLRLLDTATTLLTEVCGDKLLSSYSKADVAEFKDVLRRLPRHRSKLSATKHLNAKEAAALGLPRIHLKTANDYLGKIVELFDWSKASLEGVEHNPFDGATFTVRSNPREGRDSFSLHDLKTIFANLKRADDARFWAPIMALYTGCRSNEILKLKVTDVRREDGTGIWYFDINEDPHADPRIHHTLKRSSNRRRIPLHTDLASFGFLDFVKRCKGERLFAELKANRSGKFSDAFGKGFARFLGEIGVKRPKVDFHSFRHCFGDACDGHMPDDIIKRLRGDVRGGMLDRYGSGQTEVEVLAGHLAKMRLPKGLDLGHLVVTRQAAE